MKMYSILVFGLLVGLGVAHGSDGKIVPKVTTLTLEEGVVTEIHLSPGYATSVHVPEEVRSVVLGNPATFKAEYSEAEPKVLFLKPIVSEPAESNVLITTKTGQEISLHLISDSGRGRNSRVDFVVEYRHPRSVLIQANEAPGLSASDSNGRTAATSVDEHQTPDLPAALLDRETAIETPAWQGNELQIAVGEVREDGETSVVSFSLRNRSGHPMELLPPQLELSAATKGKHGKAIKADPVAIDECRISTRKLSVGARADGVIAFRRPAFKESEERLLLEVAAANAADRPVMALVPFTAPGLIMECNECP